MKKQVLGIKIDDISIQEATKIVESWLPKSDKHYIVTPNPEMVVAAGEDKEFKDILNKADLAVPDGQGLKFGSDIVCNTPGTDLMQALVKMASDWGFTIGLLGGRGGVAAEVAKRLQKKYPKLKISFVSEEPTEIPKTDILFVAFGHPKQEYWIYENLKNLPAGRQVPVKVAMGVGGAFDYISGRVPRAPKWIRNLGLEWLFRLIVQPWRIKRQLALLKFIYLVFFSRK